MKAFVSFKGRQITCQDGDHYSPRWSRST